MPLVPLDSRNNPIVIHGPADSLQFGGRVKRDVRPPSLPLQEINIKQNANSFVYRRKSNTNVETEKQTALSHYGDLHCQNEKPETHIKEKPTGNDAHSIVDEPSETRTAPHQEVQDTTGGGSFLPSDIQAAPAPAEDPIEESSLPENSENVYLNGRDQKTAQEVQASFLLAQHDSKNIDGTLAKLYSAVGTTEAMRLKDYSLETNCNSSAESDTSRTATTTPTPPNTAQAFNRELQPLGVSPLSLAEKRLTHSSVSTQPRWTTRVGHLLAGPIGYLQHTMEHLYKTLSIESDATGRETISPSRVSTILLVLGLLPSLVLLLIPALVLAVLLVLSCFPIVGLIGMVFALQKLQRQLDQPSATASTNPYSVAETQALGEGSKSSLYAESRDTGTSQFQGASPVVTGHQSPQQAAQKWGRLQDFGTTCVHYLKCRTQFDVLFFMDAQGSLQPRWIPYIALMLLGATPLVCLSAIPLALGLLLLVLILVPVLIAVPILLLLAFPCLAFFTFCASLPLLLYLPRVWSECCRRTCAQWAGFRVRMRDAIHHAARSTKGLCKLE